MIGQAAANHEYSVPGDDTITFTITISVVGRPECPVDQVTLIVLDENGTDVTEQAENDCLPPGTYVIRAVIVPPDATDTFVWSVDGEAAEVGERDVVSIDGDELTIQLSNEFRSVSVIAAGCATDGIDLRLCPDVIPCCIDVNATDRLFVRSGDRTDTATHPHRNSNTVRDFHVVVAVGSVLPADLVRAVANTGLGGLVGPGNRWRDRGCRIVRVCNSVWILLCVNPTGLDSNSERQPMHTRRSGHF